MVGLGLAGVVAGAFLVWPRLFPAEQGVERRVQGSGGGVENPSVSSSPPPGANPQPISQIPAPAPPPPQAVIPLTAPPVKPIVPPAPSPAVTTPAAPASTILFQDNFDAYPAGTFPAGWTLRYNGPGTQNQYVDKTYFVSSPQALHLVGSGSWSGNAYHPITFPANSVSRVRVTAKVLLDRIVSGGASPVLARVCLENPSLSTWGTAFAAVEFQADGNLYAAQSNGGNCVKLMPYQARTWYTIRIYVDFATRSFRVSVNGVTKASGLKIMDAGLPTGVELTAGHGDSPTAWFDDVMITIFPSGGAPGRVAAKEPQGWEAAWKAATGFDTEVTKLKLYKGMVCGSQWNVGACLSQTGGTASVGGLSHQLFAPGKGTFDFPAGGYVGFSYNDGKNPKNPLTMTLYHANGSVLAVIGERGKFVAYGNGKFMFVDEGDWHGYYITKTPVADGSSATWKHTGYVAGN